LTLLFSIVTGWIKGIIDVICTVHDEDLSRVPSSGPLILVGNHINFLEVPVLFTYLQPRPVTGLAKAQTWKNPFFNFLFNLWGGIPINRGEADFEAFQLAVQALRSGKILAMAPEGTRSYTGELQKGYPGVVLLALRSDSPLVPMVFWGGEKIWNNLKRFKRTDFYIRIGNPFRINVYGQALSKDVRQKAINEVMYQMAALLPEKYRGIYKDLSNATQDYLVFEPGVESNIASAT
jgi:1-acyl-sn-glycerol-3-phosphate acyltransferase